MHDIEMHEVSDEFARCWQAASKHLQHQGVGSWLRAHLNPPFLEHLSFRPSNQLFFVRLTDIDEQLDLPGTTRGLLSVADGCEGHPCLMPMRHRAGVWEPSFPGWGLVHAINETILDPPALVSSELIEMTDWELHDFAVQVVRDQLEGEKRKIMTWQGNRGVDPSMWFVGEAGSEWVVVRAVRYPLLAAKPPDNWSQIAQMCARLSERGHFASVSVANADDAFDPSGRVPATPLWRGHGLYAKYEGLERRY